MKEIELLKTIFKDSPDILEPLNEIDKEIERLNNLLKETSQTLSKQTTKAITLKSENKRLNNIINELEKFVNNYIIWGGGKNEGKVFKWTGDGYVEVYDFITDLSKKIQELKGSDKVE